MAATYHYKQPADPAKRRLLDEIIRKYKTIYAAAKHLDVSYQTLSNFLHNNKSPRLDRLRWYCDKLDISIVKLVK
jgi:transcriptional regulator with XRE-family HTH domain